MGGRYICELCDSEYWDETMTNCNGEHDTDCECDDINDCQAKCMQRACPKCNFCSAECQNDKEIIKYTIESLQYRIKELKKILKK